jgi:hypothetical protein
MTDIDRHTKSSDTTTMKHASMHKAKDRAPRLMKMQQQQTARQEIGMAKQFFSCVVHTHCSPACSCSAFRASVVLRCDASLSNRRKSKRCSKQPKQANSVNGRAGAFHRHFRRPHMAFLSQFIFWRCGEFGDTFFRSSRVYEVLWARFPRQR